jgi:Zn-dependent protease
LPENHECPKIELARMPKTEEQPLITQKQASYDYTVTYAPPFPLKKDVYFSIKEVKHLALAALLVIGIGLSSGMYPNVYNAMGGPVMLAIFTAILTASFFIHEIAHKVTAQRKGLWAEFRLTVVGAVITLISVISPIFKIISPGAVMISGFARKEDIGKISIAGPVTNIVLSAVLLAVGFFPSSFSQIFLFGAAFNAWIALFNLVPFGILDGFKIFAWNKRIWILAFAVSLVLTIISYRFIFY